MPAGVGLGLVVAVAAFENLFPVLPADVFVLAAAVIAARAGIEPLALGLAAALANAAGAFGVYLLARWRGPAILSGRLGRMLVRPGHLRLLERLGAGMGGGWSGWLACCRGCGRWCR